jgi:hypothetical protein
MNTKPEMSQDVEAAVQRIMSAAERHAWSSALGPVQRWNELAAAIRAELSRAPAAPAEAIPDNVWEALQRMIEDGLAKGPASQEDARCVARYRDRSGFMRPTPAEPTQQDIKEPPYVCDGIEQEAFEKWAESERFDMNQHPIHWLFLDAETYAARRGWKAGLLHAVEMMKAATPAEPAQQDTKAIASGLVNAIVYSRIDRTGEGLPFMTDCSVAGPWNVRIEFVAGERTAKRVMGAEECFADATTAQQAPSGQQAEPNADSARLDAIETNWELSHEFGDDDEHYWAVHCVHGSVNDREWKLIGKGDSVRESIDAALAANQKGD